MTLVSSVFVVAAKYPSYPTIGDVFRFAEFVLTTYEDAASLAQRFDFAVWRIDYTEDQTFDPEKVADFR